MTLDLDAIERRAEAATPAPWGEHKDTKLVYCENADAEDGIFSGSWVAEFASDADLAFCVAAREDIPDLIAEVRRLRKLLEGGWTDLP